jgi:hypothetical protein
MSPPTMRSNGKTAEGTDQAAERASEVVVELNILNRWVWKEEGKVESFGQVFGKLKSAAYRRWYRELLVARWLAGSM